MFAPSGGKNNNVNNKIKDGINLSITTLPATASAPWALALPVSFGSSRNILIPSLEVIVGHICADR